MNKKKVGHRILLLPGFGEDHRIFDNLMSILGDFGKFECLDYRDVLSASGKETLSLDELIDRLVKIYKIKSNDILVGHSMGGYFANEIKKSVKCQAILISSFTDTTKICATTNLMDLPKYPWIARWATQMGIFHSRIFKYWTRRKYRTRRSRSEMEWILDVFSKYQNRQLWQLLNLLLKTSHDNTMEPDLRIHGTDDDIVFPPSERYISIQGDHFILSTEPRQTAKIIENWLNSSGSIGIPERKNQGAKRVGTTTEKSGRKLPKKSSSKKKKSVKKILKK